MNNHGKVVNYWDNGSGWYIEYEDGYTEEILYCQLQEE